MILGAFFRGVYNLAAGRHALQIRNWRPSQVTYSWLDSSKARPQSQASVRSGIFSYPSTLLGKDSWVSVVSMRKKRGCVIHRGFHMLTFLLQPPARNIRKEKNEAVYLSMFRVLPWLLLTREFPTSFAAGSSPCVHARHRQTSKDLLSFGKRILSFPWICVMLTQTKQKRIKTVIMAKTEEAIGKIISIILI